MKIIAVNGSPRKNWNTDKLCMKVVEGAKSVGFEGEVIELIDLNFKGCVSCLACHLKNNLNNTKCFYKDELSPVLEKCLEADVIVIGAPIYYGFVTGMARSFMERLLFPIDTYLAENGQRVKKRNKIVPTAWIYTMNANEQQIERSKPRLKNNEDIMRGIFGECESLYSYDTYQFHNYEPYAVNIFDVKHKEEQRDIAFPKELEAAYELGVKLAKRAIELGEN